MLARPDTSQDAVVIEPVVGIIQIELAVLRVTVQIHDAPVAIRVLPRNVRKVIYATASRYRARNLETDSLRLNRIWNLPSPHPKIPSVAILLNFLERKERGRRRALRTPSPEATMCCKKFSVSSQVVGNIIIPLRCDCVAVDKPQLPRRAPARTAGVVQSGGLRI